MAQEMSVGDVKIKEEVILALDAWHEREDWVDKGSIRLNVIDSAMYGLSLGYSLEEIRQYFEIVEDKGKTEGYAAENLAGFHENSLAALKEVEQQIAIQEYLRQKEILMGQKPYGEEMTVSEDGTIAYQMLRQRMGRNLVEIAVVECSEVAKRQLKQVGTSLVDYAKGLVNKAEERLREVEAAALRKKQAVVDAIEAKVGKVKQFLSEKKQGIEDRVLRVEEAYGETNQKIADMLITDGVLGSFTKRNVVEHYRDLYPQQFDTEEVKSDLSVDIKADIAICTNLLQYGWREKDVAYAVELASPVIRHPEMQKDYVSFVISQVDMEEVNRVKNEKKVGFVGTIFPATIPAIKMYKQHEMEIKKENGGKDLTVKDDGNIAVKMLGAKVKAYEVVYAIAECSEVAKRGLKRFGIAVWDYAKDIVSRVELSLEMLEKKVSHSVEKSHREGAFPKEVMVGQYKELFHEVAPPVKQATTDRMARADIEACSKLLEIGWGKEDICQMVRVESPVVRFPGIESDYAGNVVDMAQDLVRERVERRELTKVAEGEYEPVIRTGKKKDTSSVKEILKHVKEFEEKYPGAERSLEITNKMAGAMIKQGYQKDSVMRGLKEGLGYTHKQAKEVMDVMKERGVKVESRGR